MNKKKVSVVIVTRNRSIFLERLFNSLKMQSYEDFELIVVLGPCDLEDTSTEIVGRFPQIRLFETEFKNISHARNIGLFMSAGELIAFIDDDAIPEPTWLSNLVAPFNDPQVALVGGNVRMPNGIDFQFRGARVDSLGFDEKITLECGPAPSFYTPIGANFAVRRSAALLVNGFDNVFSYYFDETDFARRIESIGLRCFHNDRAEVIHFQGVGIYRSEDGRPSSYLGIARSKVYFALKHGLRKHTFSTVQKYLDEYKEGVLSSLVMSQKIYGLSEERAISLKASFLAGMDEGYEFAVSGPPSFEYQKGGPELFQNFRKEKVKYAIAIASRSFDSKDSGIGVWTRDIAFELCRNGHPVTVIAETDSSESVIFEHPGYWVHRVNPAPPTSLSIPGHVATRNSAVVRAYADIIGRRQIDIFQYPIWDVEGIDLDKERLGGASTIVSLHTTAGLTIKDHPEWFRNGKLIAPYQNLLELEKIALEKADLILANSNAIVSDIEKFYGIKIRFKVEVIPHGVGKKETTVILPDLNHIVFLGRLENRKGIDLFLDAMSTYNAKKGVTKFKVSVVGKESDSFKVDVWRRQNKNCEYIQFLGFLKDDEVDAIFRSKPIVCVPSRYESFGLVALEAMSYGCVVIAANVGGLPEVIHNGSTGLIFEPENPMAIIALLEELRASPERAKQLSDKAQEVSNSEFSNTAVGNMLSKFFDEMRSKITKKSVTYE
jgi:glycosyltransferase involved in cell wall biosynthesis/GT2 family glycosyltransferase